MRNDPNELKELLAMAPTLNPELTNAMRVLIALLAHHEARSPDEWLSERLGVLVRQEVVHSYAHALTDPVSGVHPWVEPVLPPADGDYVREAAALDIAPWLYENCVKRLKVPVRTALEALQTAPPKADMHRLWSGSAENLTKGLPNEAKREWGARLAKRGPYREYLRPIPRHIRELLALAKDAPNLAGVTEHLASQLRLARRSPIGLRSAPRLLLVGPPAAGKTWWAEQVATVLELPCTLISMPTVTANFELSGSTTQWANPKPGRIVRAFLDSSSASPIIVLDELDKALARNAYPPVDALLDLIERSSATRWHDEFYDRSFDVSTAIIIATANDPDKIEAPLLSRFQRFDVSAPRPDQLPSMVRSVWRHYRRMRHDLPLPKDLDEAVVLAIAARIEDARSAMREFDRALAKAAERGGRIHIRVDDFRHRVPGPVYLPATEGAPRH